MGEGDAWSDHGKICEGEGGSKQCRANTCTFLSLLLIGIQARGKVLEAAATLAECGSAKENEPGLIICDVLLFDITCSYRSRSHEEGTES